MKKTEKTDQDKELVAARLELAATKDRCVHLEATISSLQANLAAMTKDSLDRLVQDLYASGQMPMVRDGSGQRVASSVEVFIRQLAADQGLDAARLYGAALPAAFGPPRGGLQSTVAYEPARRQAIEAAAERLNLDPSIMRQTLEEMGITEEMVAKSGPREGL
jgi:hypothetical protein